MNSFDHLPPLFWRTYIRRALAAQRTETIRRWILRAVLIVGAGWLLGLLLAALDFRLRHP